MHLSKFYLAIAIITIATIYYNAVSKINLQKLSKYLGVKAINIFSLLPLENFQKTFITKVWVNRPHLYPRYWTGMLELACNRLMSSNPILKIPIWSINKGI